MNATGMLFLSKQKPLAAVAADGTWQLTLLAFDRLGVHRVEPWRIVYAGPAAHAWYAQHSDALKAGQPLRVELEDLRVFSAGGRSCGPEFVAKVIRLDLAPTSANTH